MSRCTKSVQQTVQLNPPPQAKHTCYGIVDTPVVQSTALLPLPPPTSYQLPTQPLWLASQVIIINIVIVIIITIINMNILLYQLSYQPLTDETALLNVQL